MDARTAEALEASIKHWQENVAAETPYAVSTDAYACALCKLYLADHDCAGCPVAANGFKHCLNSQYRGAVHALDEWENTFRIPSPIQGELKEAWHTAAQSELAFLISLREPAESQS